MERQIELTAEGLWNDVSARLREALNDTTFQTWFGEVTGADLEGDIFAVVVPNDFTREWIEGHFLDLIRAAVRDSGGDSLRVQLQVAETPPPAAAPSPAADPAVPSAVRPLPVTVVPRADAVGINPKYTFDSFVIGSSNRFAHAAALAVAEAPAQAYNPLFIYGHTGLGKTHLLHAVANFVTDHGGGLTCRYVTSETFMNDFINSLRDKRIEGFKQRYRTYDVLLIDDVQFFEHKERIQEEFFHTFNSLYEAGRQIIMSSDRPPREISTLEERLRSRFEWGLITDIQPPDLETRIAILRKKVKNDQIEIRDPEILTFIASRIFDEHPRARGGAHTSCRLLVAHGPATLGRACPGRPQGFIPTRRGDADLDRPDPGARLRALRCHARRADGRPALPEHRLSASGCHVPLARAHGLVATEDRQGVRGSRPHDGHPRDIEDRTLDS